MDPTETGLDGVLDEDGVEVFVVSSPVSKAAQELIDAGRAKPEQGETTWGGATVIAPPLDPDGLMLLFSVSDVLHQCVDAMVQNIDGFGWVADPVINMDADDALDQVATAMTLQRMSEDGYTEIPDPPSREEAEETLATWKRRAAIEKAMLKVFFDGVCLDGGFTKLRKKTTADTEIIGWGGWEVIRNESGRIVRIRHIPAKTLRLTECDKEPTEVPMRRPTSMVTFEPIKVEKHLRRYVQLDAYQRAIYFKEYGDPRWVSSETGKAYETEAALKKAEPKVKAASECLYFANDYPGSAYGQPRWHGLTPAIMGSREADDVNLGYLGDSAIPAGLLLVSDGRIGKSSRKALETFFEKNRGKAHNRMALIEATTPKENAILEGSGRVQVQWVPLRDAQKDDATFSKYVERNADRVGECFRIPPLLRGKVKEMNRATALASIEYAEEQVFGPERGEFDTTINLTIVADLGIRFWRFRSKGPRKHDPEVQSKVADVLLKGAVVTPAEMRPFAEHILGIDLLDTVQPYMRYPIQMILAGHVPPERRSELVPDDTGNDGVGEQPPGGDPAQTPAVDEVSKSSDELARAILTLKARLERSRAADHAARVMAATAFLDGEDGGDGPLPEDI